MPAEGALERQLAALGQAGDRLGRDVEEDGDLRGSQVGCGARRKLNRLVAHRGLTSMLWAPGALARPRARLHWGW